MKTHWSDEIEQDTAGQLAAAASECGEIIGRGQAATTWEGITCADCRLSALWAAEGEPERVAQLRAAWAALDAQAAAAALGEVA